MQNNLVLIIQIPCLNEAETLPSTMACLPRQVEGCSEVKWLVVDDGSTDATVEAAWRCGADYVLSLGRRHGLAEAFSAGLAFALRAGADIIVNTDGDNQYCSSGITDLVRPIIEKRADMVVGSRPIIEIADLPMWKKALQNFGSWVVRIVSQTDVPDAPSGFRAFSREMAIQTRLFARYSYTLETIIQAGLKNLRVVSVPITVNPVTRPSRLIKNIPSFILHSAVIILRVFVIYAPMRFFSVLAVITLVPSLLLWLRFLWSYILYNGHGHVQSLILSSILLGITGVFLLAGIVGHLMAANRVLLEEIRAMLIRRELDLIGKKQP